MVYAQIKVLKCPLETSTIEKPQPMPPPSKYEPICAPIRYHDYAAVLMSVDAEWSRRRLEPTEADSAAAYLRDMRPLVESCYEQANTINRDYSRFRQANRHFSKSRERLHKSCVSDYLFNPMLWVPFGRADDLAILLIDDLGPLHDLAGKVKTAIEDICLGFCPCINDLHPGNLKPLCDLHKLFSPAPRRRVHGGKKAEDWKLPRFDKQQEMPLLAFTQYRIDSLGLLGQSVLFQQAIFRAVARKVLQITNVLTRRVKSDSIVAEMIGDGQSNIREQVRICLLDLQGAQEMGTIILCRNYSLAMSYVVALRSLTYEEVFAADTSGCLRTRIEQSPLYRKVISVSRTLPGQAVHKYAFGIDKTHVFRWTTTSLAATPEAFYEGKVSSCHGYTEALCGMTNCPGHHTEVETRAHFKTDATPPTFSDGDYGRYRIGIGDLLVPYTHEKKTAFFPMVPTSHVLRLCKDNSQTFGVVQDGDHGRDVVDFSTDIVVPVPHIKCKNKEGQYVDAIVGQLDHKQHFNPLVPVLAALRERLCYRARGLPKQRQGSPRAAQMNALHKLRQKCRRAAQLDIDELCHEMIRCGIPQSLQRTMGNLWQNWAMLIGDPYLFDYVLDLFDTLVTLQRTITCFLPEERAKELSRSESMSLGLLDAGRVEQIAELVDAINDAMTHRVARSYPELQSRDIAIDFRGGLNQLILGADAPLKCGLGLVRKFAMHERARDRLGGLTRIACMPGARCHKLFLGTEHTTQLAYLEVDVPHVLHVGNYGDYLHEAFHLLGDWYLHSQKRVYGQRPPSLPRNGVIRDRVMEVLALLLCRRFVYGKDTNGFANAHVVHFARSLVVAGTDAWAAIVQSGELLLQLFVVARIFPECPVNRQAELAKLFAVPTADATAKFDEFLSEVTPFLCEEQKIRGRWLWKDRDSHGRIYCRRLFEAAYPEMQTFLPWICACADSVYRAYCRRLEFPSDPFDLDLKEAVDRAISEGRPLVCAVVLQDSARQGRSAGRHQETDPLLLICRMLHRYLGGIVDGREKAMHLHRDPQTNEVRFPNQNKEWHCFLIDPGAPTMFCPVPKARRERLRRQIAVLKSFWDISSVMRARRFYDMLGDNWSNH